MGTNVRKMVAGDVTAVAELAEEGFADAYRFDRRANADALWGAVDADRAFVAVAEADGRVVGYCNLRSWPAGGWVDQIVVSRSHRRRGVGRELLEGIVDRARERGFWKVSLIASAADRDALSFFAASGWEVVGTMRDEIRRGVDGVLLGRVVSYELHPNA